MTNPKLPRLIIVDDHEIVRDGIGSLLLAAGCAEVVGTVGDGYGAIRLCRTVEPDIVLMDLAITRPNGIETFRRIRSARPQVRILIYATGADKIDVFSLLSEGAMGYIPKQAKGADFVNAVQSASFGYVLVPDAFMHEFLDMRNNMARSGNAYGLSLREMEVLEASAEGASTKQIADRLAISVRTVETHRSAIYRKTSCNTIGQLVKLGQKLTSTASLQAG